VYNNGELCCDIIVKKPDSMFHYIISIPHTAIPIMVWLLMTFIAYIWTTIIIRRIDDGVEIMRTNISRLFWYPGVLFIVFAPGLTDIYTINYFYDLDEATFLFFAQFMLTRSIGFIHAIIYGVQMKSLFKKNEEMEKEEYEADLTEHLSESMIFGRRINDN